MNIRRTGLSAMGLGDLLIKLKLRYGSPEALALVREVYRFIRDEAYLGSVEISKEKGPFPKFDPEKYLQGHFIRQLPAELQAAIGRYGIRNAVLLTQAPTGTTSLLSGVSSGIEPVYDFVFIRKDRIGEHEVHHSLYKDWLDAHPGETVPDYFVNAKQLTPEEHIGMQAAIQEFVDSSISKTVNAPEEHTPAQVATLYEKAYELGCKGVTYFRENSRDISVLYSKDDKKKKELKEAEKAQELAPDPSPGEDNRSSAEVSAGSRVGAGITPRTRPAVTVGKTYKITTGYGTLYVTVNDDEEARPFEVFATIGKTGGFFAAKSEAICRLISLSLRSGISVSEVIDQLKGIRGPMPSWTSRGMVLSIPDGIAQILEEHTRVPQATLPLDSAPKIETGPETFPEAEVIKMAAYDAHPAVGLAAESNAPAMVRIRSIANTGFAPQCPECSAVLMVSEGCMTCRGCGYSKCG
jgi:ribonucleoside-diphosphate reductase alpha chain